MAADWQPLKISGQAVGAGYHMDQSKSGKKYTCGLDSFFQLWCWGMNSFGQLGIGTTEARTLPTEVSGSVSDFAVATRTLVQLTTTKNFFVGETTPLASWESGSTDNKNDAAKCWECSWQAITVGERHSCGLQIDGSLWCWGAGFAYQLGRTQNPTSAVTEPAMVGADTSWTKIRRRG